MTISDAEIDRLIALEKAVINPRARRITQRGSERINYEATGQTGEQFFIYVTRNIRLADGFSCGLLYVSPSGEKLTLVRYNGPDHEHTNALESGKPLPRACHIHRATERYINAGRKAEHHAETTTRYTDLDGALRALIADCNVRGLDDNKLIDAQLSLM